MANAFISADTSIFAQFKKDSDDAIETFKKIKNDFNDINTELLKNWKGKGADAYKKETNHILENVGGIKDVLDSINEGAVTTVQEYYDKLDEELAAFNMNPSGE